MQGRVGKVNYYDKATVGSGCVVDEKRYSFDELGYIIKFAMDRYGADGLYDGEVSRVMGIEVGVVQYEDGYPACFIFRGLLFGVVFKVIEITPPHM